MNSISYINATIVFNYNHIISIRQLQFNQSKRSNIKKTLLLSLLGNQHCCYKKETVNLVLLNVSRSRPNCDFNVVYAITSGYTLHFQIKACKIGPVVLEEIVVEKWPSALLYRFLQTNRLTDKLTRNRSML